MCQPFREKMAERVERVSTTRCPRSFSYIRQSAWLATDPAFQDVSGFKVPRFRADVTPI